MYLSNKISLYISDSLDIQKSKENVCGKISLNAMQLQMYFLFWEVLVDAHTTLAEVAGISCRTESRL